MHALSGERCDALPEEIPNMPDKEQAKFVLMQQIQQQQRETGNYYCSLARESSTEFRQRQWMYRESMYQEEIQAKRKQQQAKRKQQLEKLQAIRQQSQGQIEEHLQGVKENRQTLKKFENMVTMRMAVWAPLWPQRMKVGTGATAAPLLGVSLFGNLAHALGNLTHTSLARSLLAAEWTAMVLTKDAEVMMSEAAAAAKAAGFCQGLVCTLNEIQAWAERHGSELEGAPGAHAKALAGRVLSKEAAIAAVKAALGVVGAEESIKVQLEEDMKRVERMQEHLKKCDELIEETLKEWNGE